MPASVGRTALTRRFRIFRTMMISKRIESVATMPPTALAIIISPVDKSDGTVGGEGEAGGGGRQIVSRTAIWHVVSEL